MELNELFIKRRSMRSYDPEKKVTKEQIEELIRGYYYGWME